jgi:predicted nucleic acid-binding protein
MKVISNTSPLCYLILIDEINVLQILFNEIIIPEAVYSELIDLGAPDVVRKWIMQLPKWIKVEQVTEVKFDPILNRLHIGEREAILLAKELSADLIILDERLARKIAMDKGLNVTGLLGILIEASTRGIVDLPTAIEKLNRTTFRASPQLLKTILDKYFRSK